LPLTRFPKAHTMRTLNASEIDQVAGGTPQIAVDVNVLAKYVHVNLVDNGQVVKTLFSFDWSKWGLPPTTTAA
jgi:hypothetical protein